MTIALPCIRPAPVEASLTEAGPITGRDILCFSHDWTGDPLSKTHFMRLLARSNRVLWVNSIGYRMPRANRADLSRAWQKISAWRQPLREAEPNLFVLNPLVVPAYGIAVVRSLNQWWLRSQVLRAMHTLRFRRPINWVFNPTAAVIAGTLGEETLIYHCVDEYSALIGVQAEAIRRLEEKLLLSADLVVVSAEPLLESKRRANPRTVLVRHGVDFPHFRQALAPQTQVPDDIASLPRPRLGFFGLVSEDWIDFGLLSAVAKRFSHGSVVVIGMVTADVSPLNLPNVHFLGRKAYGELPAYCKGFDVALNPFRISELTRNANPLKVREYLAAGLPVVSTAVPEVAVLDLCRIGKTQEEFLRQIGTALEHPGPQEAISDRVRSQTWEARLAEVEQHLAAVKALS